MNKIIAQVGAAAAFTLAASLAVVPASAADLGGWGRGSIKDDYAAPARSAASPCYFRADTGYSWSNAPTLRWSAWNPPAGYNEKVTSSNMDDTWTGGVGLGCGSGSRGFRYEAMLGYHGQRGIEGRTSPYQQNFGATPIVSPIHSAVTTYTGMVNGYFDLGNFRGVVPYIGAGVGLAYHQMDEYQITAAPSSPLVPYKIHGDNDLTLAWSLMTGFAYQISERAILDFGYRYIDFGRASTARHDVFAQGNLSRLSVDDMTAHEIKIGLRYHLGSDGCCAAQYAPMK